MNIYSTVPTKVNFAHRARSREYRSSEKGLISRKHRVSSVTSEFTRDYRVLRVTRDFRARLAFLHWPERASVLKWSFSVFVFFSYSQVGLSILDRGLIFNMAAVKELPAIFLFHFFVKFYLGEITVVCGKSE